MGAVPGNRQLGAGRGLGKYRFQVRDPANLFYMADVNYPNEG